MRERLPPIDPAAMRNEQRAAADAFTDGRGYAPRGPFAVMLRSPQVMLRAKAMGDYLRFANALPRDISEFAILLAAHHWRQDYEWVQHRKDALAAGVSADVIDQLASGERPTALSPDQAAVYDFCSELNENRSVSEATFEAVRERFSEAGLVDLVALQGYYGMLAMVMNVAGTPAPGGVRPLSGRASEAGED